MNRLLCCLLGFPDKDAQVLRSLTRLFRPSLTADWAIEVGVSEECDLLVCDLDDAGGRHAWNSPAPPGLLRAAASGGDVDAGALLLRKPLRGHGPSGIVQVLNAAAAIKRPGAATPAPGATIAPVAAAPPAFFKPEEPARAPTALVPQPPAAAEAPPPTLPVPAETRRNTGGTQAVEQPTAAGRDDATPSAAAPSAAAAVPVQLTEALRHGHAAEAPPPSWAAESEPEGEPAQDDANIKDILRRMRFATLGKVSEARTMLAALRSLRDAGVAHVLEAPNLKPICLIPQARAWLSPGTPPEIFDWLGRTNGPVRMLPFGDVEEARDAAASKDEGARPFEQLMWLACIRTPPEDLAAYETALFRLKRWPDLGNLPHEPHHMHWCGILTRQQAPLHALAGSGGVPPAQTAAFLDACGELGILERTSATPEEIAAVELPVVSKKGRERISLFKNILGRLRIFRS
jgi:hypothetical protein